MVNPLLIATGAKVLGDVFRGKSKSDEARKQQKKAIQRAKLDYQNALNARNADQAEAAALAAADEARAQAAHKAGIGYDLKRLRDEATAAGFNPLTVLQNTGAANYAVTPAPVMSTPFIGRPTQDTVSAVLGTGQARVDSAGYIGDALAGGASTYIGVSQEAARLAADRELAAAIRSERNPARAPFAPPPKVSDARPPGQVQGPQMPVRVRFNGTWQYLDPGAAQRIGIGEGETLVAEDIEALLGDIQSEVMLGADAVVNGNISGPFQRAPKPMVRPAPVPPPTVRNPYPYRGSTFTNPYPYRGGAGVPEVYQPPAWAM